MTKPQSIKIDDVEYIRKDETTEGDIKIVVLDRGYIYVGKVTLEDNFVVISNAKNIRYWGTTKGLGELVNGPTPTTKLDTVGTVRVNTKALISLIDVDQSKWSNI